MYIIAGLGNPGKKYEGTRHNTGYGVLDILSQKYDIPLTSEKFRGLFGKGSIEGHQVLLVKPLTFMNLSGECLRPLTDYFKVEPKEGLLVISDDIDLPVGKIRIRTKGSAGGHNGLKNIVTLLGTDDFTRIKIGVGAKPPEWDLVDWVLGRFHEDDIPIMAEASETAAKAVSCILTEGAERAMNLYNTKKSHLRKRRLNEFSYRTA